ncbi:MAG: hypothetical protein OEM82_16030, partial [Acidobacteriota bacterium]|nr:hypothetical protein [Acidobacteriota bacterium]
LPEIERIPTSNEIDVDALPEPENTRELDQVVTLASSGVSPDAIVPSRVTESRQTATGKPKKRNGRKSVKRKRNKSARDREAAPLPDSIKDVVIYY